MRDVSVVTLGRDGMENACVTQLFLIQEITALTRIFNKVSRMHKDILKTSICKI